MKKIKNQVKVSVSGKNCLGCIRAEKPIMISLDGKVNDNYEFLDAFLTEEDALELIKEIQKTIEENKK